MEIQRTAGIVLHGRHDFVPNQHKGDTRLALDAFVGRTGTQVHTVAHDIKVFTTKRAHRVEQKQSARLTHNSANFSHGIEQAGCGLMLDHGHCGDSGVVPQGGCNLLRVRRFGPGIGQFYGRDTVGFSHLAHPVAIDPVVNH